MKAASSAFALIIFTSIGLMAQESVPPTTGEQEQEVRRDFRTTLEETHSQYSEVVYHNADPHLTGMLYLPPGKGPFPVMIYNHDSSNNLRHYPWLVRTFVVRGLALFIPWRCGAGLSKDSSRAISPGQGAVSFLQQQELDVEDAVAWVKTQPWADTTRMAMMGNSYGGIMTVLSATHRNGIRAFIPTAPGALSWEGQKAVREMLMQAVHQATAPMFIFQAANDKTVQPTLVLFKELTVAGLPGESKIFPADPTGHGFGCMNPTGWSDDVFRFLEANLGPLPLVR
jgi:dienelactone hydrolase